MAKSMDVHQLADQFSKSLTGETRIFEQFLIDYFESSPREAFNNLDNSGADATTRQCATRFNNRAFEQNLARIKEEMEERDLSPVSKQGKVLQEFFKNYFYDGGSGTAWEEAQREINQDPDLRSDAAFQTRLRKIAEKVRPTQKERKEISLQEDESVFFKLGAGPRKRVEHKLTDFEVKKLLSSSLTDFYTSRLPEGVDKSEAIKKMDVSQEVEAIFKHRQLPLALQLAHQDTAKKSEQVTVELRELDRNTQKIKNLSAQGVKFGYKDSDLRHAVDAEQSTPKPKSPTEKVDIVRELIIDLRTYPVSTAFKEAIKKATEYGDKELFSVLQKNLSILDKNNTTEGRANLLADTYKLYVNQDMRLYSTDVAKEAGNLFNGIKNESVRMALDELQKKDDALTVSVSYNRFFQKAIHSVNSKDLARYRTAAMEEAVNAIAEKTGVKLNVANAKSQPSPEQGKDSSKNLGSYLN